MITSSGGFFSRQAFRGNTIDGLSEASAAVEGIIESDPAHTPGPTPEPTPTTQADISGLVAVVGQYAQRVRLLTWAVVAIVIVLVLKEVD